MAKVHLGEHRISVWDTEHILRLTGMSHAHFFLDFVIQCNIFIYSEIHALYYYDIYFDLSIRRFTSASCMSWMSAICVHMQMATFGLVRMRIVSFATIFRFVTQHSSLCNAPCHWERHCVTTLKMAVKETMMRRICLEIKKFVHIIYAETKHPRLL